MQHALLFTRSVLGAGIQSTLRDIPDWAVWHATTQCPEQMVELARFHRPTVTLFDMTCLPVVELFQMLGQASVKLFGAIIVTTLSGIDEEELFRLSMWGVAAHISGNTEPGELAGILHRVTTGEYLLSSDCLRQTQGGTARRCGTVASKVRLVVRRDVPPAVHEAPARPSPLTVREAEVLICIAQGMTNKEIADTLGRAENTIKNHITSIFHKLEVYDRTSAVVQALQRQWILLPEDHPISIPTSAVA